MCRYTGVNKGPFFKFLNVPTPFRISEPSPPSRGRLRSSSNSAHLDLALTAIRIPSVIPSARAFNDSTNGACRQEVGPETQPIERHRLRECQRPGKHVKQDVDHGKNEYGSEGRALARSKFKHREPAYRQAARIAHKNSQLKALRRCHRESCRSEQLDEE